MSNPAVVKFQEKKIHNLPFFIDDNYGESIHVHYGDMRLDFSYVSYAKFTEEIETSLDDCAFDRFRSTENEIKKADNIYNRILSIRDYIYNIKKKYRIFRISQNKIDYKKIDANTLTYLINR